MTAPPQVPPHIAGAEQVTRDWLMEHLGRGPFLTWQRLLWCRNSSGITWATRAGTAKHISCYVKSTEETRQYAVGGLKKHLVRLREVLLVKDFPNFDVEMVDGKIYRRQYRIVYGSIVKPTETFTIPDFSKAALEAKGPVRWGGGRANSGPEKGAKYRTKKRPEKCSSGADECSSGADVSRAGVSVPLEQIGSVPLEQMPPPKCSSGADECSSGADENVQVGPPSKSINTKALSEGDLVPFASQKEQGGPGGPPSVSESSEQNETGGEGVHQKNPPTAAALVEQPSGPILNPPAAMAAPRPSRPVLMLLPSPPTQPPTPRPSLQGGAPGTPTKWEETIAQYKANRPKVWGKRAPMFGECGVPAFPSGLDYDLPPPPMPTLRHEDNPEEGVQFLERWYNAALTSRYPKAHTMRVAKAGGTRPYWELALAECLKHNIRPGAWVAFSIDEWRVTSPQRALKSPPDVKFIFGPRMQSRLWVYRDVEAEYAPSRKMYTPDARSVLDRLHLVKAFATSVGWDEPKIQAEVARQFPKGFQQETLAAARTTKATNAALQQQLRAGKWLWTKDYDGKKARALAARRPSMEEGTHG